MQRSLRGFAEVATKSPIGRETKSVVSKCALIIHHWVCKSHRPVCALQRHLSHVTMLCGVYICSRLYEVLAHAELFGLFHLFTLFFEVFDYTARVQRV